MDDHVLIYIYNHGFPDYSIDYVGEEDDVKFELTNWNLSTDNERYRLEVLKDFVPENTRLSRFCSKMRDICLESGQIDRLSEKSGISKFIFITFNTNGIGKFSQRGEFYDKTLVKDMYDIETIADYFSGKLFKYSKLIMIGISTGAFLTFSYSTNHTRRCISNHGDNVDNSYFISNSNLIGLVCVACVDDIPKSYCLDFSETQLNEFSELGYTRVSLIGNKSNKLNIGTRLISRDYMESYKIFPSFNFLLENKKKVINYPILLIHGTDDQSVPFYMSLNLLNLNNEAPNSNDKKYIRLVEINHGNHLLTNSKHMKKAQSNISSFIYEII
ncbi:putative alpha beta hydrolase [Cryptosporidium canis]|uniref:Alpha beta hydrolase n=1 Tax=Cryptosporidium canis TaxID=195482 RepID=A0A9D5DHU3_9CRYT|nr:putative alpha beta hydrolase [Cryptosporidium canis]